ncbi:MAG: hypothetical protein U9R74_01620 [Pseudomonadota bacterium]|nr:hypothetical protein [Pseudomonadota bacterium]
MSAVLSIVLFLILTLQGCVGQTTYHPMSDGTGYDVQRLDGHRYELNYTATAITRRSQLEQYLMYRAAKLTLDEGMSRFEVVERDFGSGAIAGMDVEGDAGRPHHEFEHRHLWFGNESFAENPSTPQYSPFSLHTVFMVIEMLGEGKARPELDVFDAAELVRALGPGIAP